MKNDKIENENMKIYNIVRNVPDTAKKQITAGNLKGFTDINPMWRIKILTETFGVCGFGWYTEITNKWIEHGKDGKDATFVEINLFVKMDGEWSKPIIGIGGSMFTNIFKGSPSTSDESFKMAYTDALSVACKSLGIGADVYYEKDRTKYNQTPNNTATAEEPKIICPICGKKMQSVTLKSGKVVQPQNFIQQYGKCVYCLEKEKKETGDTK